MKNLKKFTAVFCSFLLICLFVTNGIITENASAAAKLKATSLKLTVNQTSKIVINGKSKLTTYTFKSSDTKIATVNKTGVVKGVKAGTATITVNSTINKKVSKVGSVKVTISQAAKPTVAPTAAPTVTPMPTPTIVPVEVPKDPITGEIDYSKAKLIALTFDDGPNLTITSKVLDKLEKYGVVASFFLIGNKITDATKPIMERELELGCEINNHSWSHSGMATMTADKIKKEINDTSKKIYDMVGVTPKFFRPPYIQTSATMYNAIDLPFINGINGEDWAANVTAAKRAEKILAQAKDGNIILMHDFEGNDKTVEALDIIIPELQRQGYVFVTVSQLFEYKGVDPNKESTLWSIATK
ncbi:MAG: polysaccharide deacetylase family protein [Mobilitalea sp.]